MEYLEKKRREQLRQTAQDRIDYRDLLGKLATEMKLAPKDEQKLDVILTRLGMALDAVERDVAILRRRAELTAATAPRPEIVGNLAAIEKDADDYRDRETKALAELAAAAQEINSRLAVENQRLAVVDRAAEQLEALQGLHWELFGLPDPAIEARKRNFAQVIYSNPAEPPYSLVAFESVMSDPKTFANLFSVNATTDWIALPGQKPEELQRLLSLARQLVQNEKPGRYAIDVADIDRAKHFTNMALASDPATRMKPEYRTDFDQFAWLTAPGQSDEQRDKCVAAITHKPKPKDPGESPVSVGSANKSWVNPA